MFLQELTESQKKTFICLAHDIIVSDGILRADENFMMEQLRREIGLSNDFQPHYITLEGIDSIFDTRSARIAVLLNLIRLAYADGAFEIEERFLLAEICQIFSIDSQLFALAENWVRRLIALEKEARTLM